jgi:NADH-quinone oxidoreductase subunit N
VNLQSLIDNLVSDTVARSLPLFRPELVLCGAIVVLLLAKVFPLVDRIPPFAIALVGSIAALIAAMPNDGIASWGAIHRVELFTGMLVYDAVTAFMRLFLTLFLVLFVILSRITGLADREDGQDFYALVFGATIGMCIMASANHLLSLFLGVEMASVPSYVLAGIVKGRRRSSEASLKYAVYGAGAAGVMLYGISLLAGLLGAAHIPTVAQRLIEFNVAGKLADHDLSVMVLALGGLMIGVGLAFKLSAVPFHFWCPDVFEGASAEVAGFLSVASKTAALALLVRVGVGLGHEPVAAKPKDAEAKMARIEVQPAKAPSAVQFVKHTSKRHTVLKAAGDANSPTTDAAAQTPLSPVRTFFVVITAIVAAVTCTFGNLAAYGQRNIKRLLAYSTIAHAGYMMMPVAAAVALMGRNEKAAQEALSALFLYAVIYLFMNLGAFAIVAFLRNSMQSEDIKDYAGLIGRSPVVAVAMTVILFSLVGLPPLAGFWPKLGVLLALYNAGGPLLIFVLVVAAMNTVVSLVYYLRVAKTICMDAPPDTSRPVSLGFFPTTYALALTLPVLILGIVPEVIAPMTRLATAGLFG